ncbi:hypothetical protein [Sanguibacter antarcticus]|uniref:hypothetical protein n=1 Tax=Sanguibacter antarcticus TaxID=372484 RepID=UPI000BF29751|nr:hypothetical protein [Sanguibacter antarcticus]
MSSIQRVGAVVVLLLVVLLGVVLNSASEDGHGGHMELEAPMSVASGLLDETWTTPAASEILLLPLDHPAADSSLHHVLVVCCALVAAAILVPVVSRWILGRSGLRRVHDDVPAVLVAALTHRRRGNRPIPAHSLCVLRV